MKIKLIEAVNGYEVLRTWRSNRLSPSMGFALSRVAKSLERVLESYQEERLKLLNLHGIPPKTMPGEYTFETPEKQAEFVKGMKELINSEVELEAISPISVKAFDAGCAGFSPSIEEMATLAWLFTENEK